VADPGRDGLEIGAGVDRLADEIVAHAVMRKCSNAGEPAHTFYGLRRLPILLAGRFRRGLIMP